MSDRPPIKAPQIDASTQEFWDGTRRGSAADQALRRLRREPLLPAAVLPEVLEYATSRGFDAAGTGTLYTYSVVYANDLPSFRDRVPYVVAMVDLDEGPRMETNLVDCPLDELRVGMRVTVVFEDEGEMVLPRFRPA